MKVKLTNGSEYTVRFAYNEQAMEIAGLPQGEKRLVTCATIEKMDGENATMLGQGCAIQNPLDHFKKSTGRHLALTRVLEAANMNYDERKAVWNTYFRFCKSEGIVPDEAAQ